MTTRDHTRAIVASLFSSPPGTNAPPAEQHVAHVKTLEGQQGTPSYKERFLIISALRDGRLKLHKAKENNNGTFSIGKTWPLEDLRQIEVARRTVDTPAGPQSHPLEFTLFMNGKQYKYETQMPSAQQAAFLVKMVRCWRTYMNGRGAPDLVLVGFNVDNSNGSRPTTAPASSSSAPPPPPMQPRGAPSSQSLSAASGSSAMPYTVPQPSSSSSTRENFPLSASTQSNLSSQSQPAQSSYHRPTNSHSQSSSLNLSVDPHASSGSSHRPPRPSTAASTRTTASNYRQTPSPPPNSGVFPGRKPSVPNLAAAAATASSQGRSASPAHSLHQQQRVISPPPNQRPPSQAETSRSRAESGGGPGGGGAPPRPPSSHSLHARPASSASHHHPPFQQPARPPSSHDMGPRDVGPRDMGPRDMGPRDMGPRDGPLGDGVPQKPAWRKNSVSAAVNAQQQRNTPKSSSTNGSTAPPPLPVQPTASAPQPPTGIVAPQPRRPMPDPEDIFDDDTVLSNVEEMLEGFEWRGGGGGELGKFGGAKSQADEIERRLVGELKALEAASIHAIIESDDRVNFVIKHLDDALAELDKMDLLIGMYKSQLNLMNDDIAHIEGQNRGLQVQTSNQRMLLAELDNLMETIHIPEADLTTLSQGSLENPQGIEQLEKAAVSLYKALLSTRDSAVGEMAAASEHVGDYQVKASQFCKRIFDFLCIMFKYQVNEVSNAKDTSSSKGPKLPSHAVMEDFLGRYCGLMLFVKEIDQSRYQQICAAYFTAMSDLHRAEIQALMTTFRGQIRKVTEDELEASFANTKESPTLRQGSMRRVGTVVRSPLEGGRKDSSGKISGSEAFNLALQQITPRIVREQGFISDFLAITALDASITFADYMILESYFRRGATAHLASQQGKLKDIRSAMEVVWGFLEAELKDWVDAIIRSDNMQIVGVLAALDRALVVGERERNEFLLRTFQKQYQRSSSVLERSCKEQIKSIEQTKLTLKKRKGVVPFVRVFPLFVDRVESQLEGAGDLNIRRVVDDNYERMVTTIFDCLQQMAKMDGEGHGVAAEDKDQLNYHVIIIENMHHIVQVFSKQSVAPLATFVSQAREKYHQNLELYIRLVLRRPLARALDFFQGFEQLLRTTPPTEVSLHSAYTKSALRRTLSDLRGKDIRKATDALYKRVDKHFGDVLNPAAEHSAVLKEVWKACETEVQRLVANWKSLVEKCYPDEKVFDFTKDDVRDFFVKAQRQQ